MKDLRNSSPSKDVTQSLLLGGAFFRKEVKAH